MYKSELLSVINLSQKISETLKTIHYDKNELLFNVPKNKYVYDCIYSLTCSSKYYIYIYDKLKKNCTNIVINLSSKQSTKFLKIFNKELNFGKKIVIVISPKELNFNHEYIDITEKYYDVLCHKNTFQNTSYFPVLVCLKKIFGIPLKDIICIPNMEIINDEMIVYNQSGVDKLLNTIQYELLSYDFDVSKKYLENMFPMCMTRGFEIYKGIPDRDKDTDVIKKFHLSVKRELYQKYCHNVDYLFDMGCGRLTDLFYWNENNVKILYCVEPSLDSIKSGQDRYENVKKNIKTKLYVVNGFGDVNFENDVKYKDIIKNKYDVITFQFTLHYMIDNIDIVMKNLKLISKKGTKILVTCMNGNLIEHNLKKKSQIVVRNDDNKIIFAIDKFSNNNILVYLKGGYGMEHGSVERIIDVNKLTDIFHKNNFKLIEKKPFLNYHNKIKEHMSSIQKNVSYYYVSLVYEFM